MSQVHPISRLGRWEGYEVRDEHLEQRGEASWCVIRLEPVRGAQRHCSGCGQSTAAIHDLEARRVRDLPLFEHAVELIVPRVRVACPACGPKLERLSWLAPYARVTQRLGESVGRLCMVMAIRHVSRFFGLDWKTVKRVDRARLERVLGPVDLDGLEVIAMDEFAIQKGHRYATVIVEPRRKRVLWVGRGRGREDVRPFFELLGPERCARLQAAVMDQNPSYQLEVQRHCPNAAITYDLFHVVARYGREVIDRVRIDRANELRGDRRGRHVVKGARWLLLKNRDSLRPGEDVQLEELLAANHALFVVYVLRDALKELWRYRHAGYAARAWRSWYRKATRSRIEPLRRFARNLRRPYLAGILAHCRWPLGTNLVEGINNKIKVIKRMAYGYRDDEYFFLKIRAAFPSKTVENCGHKLRALFDAAKSVCATRSVTALDGFQADSLPIVILGFLDDFAHPGGRYSNINKLTGHRHQAMADLITRWDKIANQIMQTQATPRERERAQMNGRMASIAFGDAAASLMSDLSQQRMGVAPLHVRASELDTAAKYAIYALVTLIAALRDVIDSLCDSAWAVNRAAQAGAAEVPAMKEFLQFAWADRPYVMRKRQWP